MKKNDKTAQELFDEYNSRFDAYSDNELIEIFNGQVGNQGWGTARASYGGAIREQLKKRNIDFSVVGDDRGISYAAKVVLKGKKLYL